MTLPSRGTQNVAIVNSLAEGERWYVAGTLANREFSAALQLEAQRFHVFLPYVNKSVRHARRTRQVKRAAFPGYMFVALDPRRDRWRSINGTFGVSRLITGGDGAPAPVPHGVVETLFSYLDESGACRFDRDLVVGQTVRVLAGPLADVIGRLVRLDAHGRVQVLLGILGGQVYATLERAVLEAA
jgi:transcriptional antiterminator RfaH